MTTVPAKQPLPLRALVIALAALALAGGGVGAWLFTRTVAKDEAADIATDKADESEAVVAAKTAITGRFPQAERLDFGPAAVHLVDDRPAVCGTADIDEPQDSFDGPERFTYLDGKLLIEEFDGTSAVDQSWSYLCR